MLELALDGFVDEENVAAGVVAEKLLVLGIAVEETFDLDSWI